jgi:sugar phosphate isomerase/epimerase
MKFAFSTVACPDWTLDRVADVAQSLGFAGVELRTFGWNSSASACDPSLTDARKVQQILRAGGAEPVCLSTGIGFGRPVTPPVIGWAITDVHRDAREASSLVELAALLECPFIRVFGHEFPRNEKHSRAVDRIVSRLLQVADAGRARQVRVLVENGGSFATAAELCELLDEADHPCLGALYNVAEAHAAGEAPEAGINVLGERLMMAKVKDFAGGKPVALGEGTMPVQSAMSELRRSGFSGPVSYELDRLWLGMGMDAEPLLRKSVQRMFEWGVGAPSAVRTGRMVDSMTSHA